MLIEELYNIYRRHPSIETDTRKLKPGDIFFALKGPNFNGNSFAKKAIESGAAYAVIDEEVPTDIGNEFFGKTFLVPDVLTTLQQLALHHRNQFNVPMIAITGSNGKTTTKELIHAVLSTCFKTYTTEGNLNNHIGVPLTILRIKNDAEMAVIEMGANHLKEIESYCRIALPTHGIITNCGKAHLEGFGSEEGVRKAKGELFDFLRSNNGTAFVMSDYEYLQVMSNGIPNVICYGTENADLQGSADQDGQFLSVTMTKGMNGTINTKLVGDYNLPNILAAVCIGKHFGIADKKIKDAIENYTPSNSRSQLIEKGSNKFILDAYNANPSSMKLAIENFANTKNENKVLMLGGMAELGSASLDEHKAIIELIKKYPWKEVALVGGDFLKLDHPWQKFENSLLAKDWFRSKNFQNSFILVKGSRSMQMEKILDQ